jgi:hypothetical protein
MDVETCSLTSKYSFSLFFFVSAKPSGVIIILSLAFTNNPILGLLYISYLKIAKYSFLLNCEYELMESNPVSHV